MVVLTEIPVYLGTLRDMPMVASLPARRSKRGICYGNVAGWLGGCLSQPVLCLND